MILVGQFDSPFVRRVAISLHVLGFDFAHDTRSVFGDFESMRATNPMARIPSLILDDGATLIDSGAILDWLDREVGDERALLAPSGHKRTHDLQLIAYATGGVDKFGALAYERIIRPAQYRWPDWIERLATQGNGALVALEREDWAARATLDQAQISAACLVAYVRMTAPDRITKSAFPRLNMLSDRCEALPAFQATRVSTYNVPAGD